MSSIIGSTDAPAAKTLRPAALLALGAALLGLSLVCYLPALQGTPVWDDAAHLTRPDLQTWSGLRRIWTEPGATQQYYPVLHTAFWLEHRLWGDAFSGYHLANVVEHAGACLLLALCLLRLGLRPLVAGLAAVLFAVHPVHAESVAWISEQKNTLSLCFYLLAALAWLRHRSAPSPGAYLAAFVAFLLALESKSVTATLPAALLVVAWWRTGTISWRRDVTPLLPWFAAALAMGAVTARIEHTLIGATGPEYALAPGWRVLLAARAAIFYLGHALWPAGLNFVYPHWAVPRSAATGVLCLALVLAISGTFGWLSRRSRGPFALWLLFLGALLPALGFVDVYPFRYSYVADHFQYLADLAVVTGVAWVVATGGRGKSGGGAASAAAGCLLVLALAPSTRGRAAEFRSSRALWTATLARNPDCWMAHNNLGAELAAEPAGREQAIAHYQAALRLKRDYAEAHNNLGNAYAARESELDAAIGEFRAALRLAPGFIEAELNLANALARRPETRAEALRRYAEILAASPNDPVVHFCYANALAAAGDRAAAERQFRAALTLRPGYAEACANLAALLAADPARLAEAVEEYRQAQAAAPGRPELAYGLGVVWGRMPGHAADARRSYEAALALDPGQLQAHNNLAVLLAQSGDLEGARRHWEAVVRLDPGFLPARRNLELLARLRRRSAPAPSTDGSRR